MKPERTTRRSASAWPRSARICAASRRSSTRGPHRLPDQPRRHEEGRAHRHDGTDAADDYEVVRTADVLLTINRTEEDRENGQFVLYFSEMRNAETGLKMRFSQDLRCMRFIIDFLGYD
jgi:hypothetical protein